MSKKTAEHLPAQKGERQSVVIYCPACQRDLHQAPPTRHAVGRIPADVPCASCDDREGS